jgi:hypothetical protein
MREHDYAVISLLPIEHGVLVSQTLETLERKPIVRTLGFLQAEDIRPDRFDEFRHALDAQPYRIDVPGGDGEAHVCQGTVISSQ